MKSLPRLALGAFYAAMLAGTTYATTITCSTTGSNGPSGGITQNWNIIVPSTVNVTTSVTVNTTSGGGGGSSISRNGTYVTGANTGRSGAGTATASNAAYGQAAGNYYVSQGFGGPPNTVYGNVNTTLTW